MPSNATILADRIAQLNAITGPRVGDFLRLPRADERAGEFTRFTHIWDDTIQTGGQVHGSYYLGNGYLSYSGGLDPGIAKSDIIPSEETKDGQVWFFDEGITGPHRGVNFMVPLRVFIVRPGGNTRNIYATQTGYFLSYSEAPREHGYHWTISHRGCNHTAFRHEHELHTWLANENLRIAGDPHQSQRIFWPSEVA